MEKLAPSFDPRGEPPRRRMHAKGWAPMAPHRDAGHRRDFPRAKIFKRRSERGRALVALLPVSSRRTRRPDRGARHTRHRGKFYNRGRQTGTSGSRTTRPVFFLPRSAALSNPRLNHADQPNPPPRLRSAYTTGISGLCSRRHCTRWTIVMSDLRHPKGLSSNCNPSCSPHLLDDQRGQ